MAEVSSYVAGPYQGVSQAPQQVRLEGSCSVMEDCIAVIPNGIQKRPPLEYATKLLSSGANSNAVFEDVPRGAASTDLTLLINYEASHNVVRLFNTSSWTPVAITVDGAVQAYLDAATSAPNRDMRTVSVEDTTFITNRKTTVANTSSTAATRPFEAIIWVKTGEYSRHYNVTVVQLPASTFYKSSSYQPASGAASADATGVGTDVIAKGIYDGTIVSGSGAVHNGDLLTDLTTGGFTVQLLGSLVYISHPTLDFTVTVTDDQGGTAMTVLKGSVQNFSDLPEYALDGFVVRVAQSSAGANSDFFVQFQGDASLKTGVWKECLAPGAALGLDAATMPCLLQNVSGTWHLKAGPWLQREVGDSTLVPDPQFIGDQVTDLTWWRGRLGIISNAGPALSASDSPYKYYTTTLTAALDSDAIFLQNPAKRNAYFKAGLTFDLRFMVFADKVQAIVSSAGTVAASQTRIDELSDADYTDAVPVQASNHKLYFCAPRTSYMTVFEMAIDRLSGLALAEELSTAVPTYLPATLDRAATLKTDYMTVYCTSGASQAYVHSYRHAQQQAVQNAFYKWNFPWNVCGHYIKNAIAYWLMEDSAGAFYVFTQDLSPNRLDPGSSAVLTCLDGRITEAALATPSYSGGNTTFVLPYASDSVIASVRHPATTTYPEGYLPTIVSVVSSFDMSSGGLTHITLQGDWRSVPLFFGIPYSSYFIPNKWYVVSADGKPQHTGELTLRRLKVDVAAFSYLRAEVTIKGRPTRSFVYAGTYAGDTETGIGEPNVSEARTLTFSINGKAKDTTVKFINDTHLGFKMAGYEWWGEWTPRARRLS